MDKKMNFMNVVREFYYYTHIIPTEADFLNQINNVNVIYLILYWIKKEHLYELFIEEEMDLYCISLMQENDFRYFHLENDELFREFVQALQ